MTILIDVAQLKAVSVDDVLAEQIVGDPGFAPALEPSQPPGRVPGDEDDLRGPPSTS